MSYRYILKIRIYVTNINDRKSIAINNLNFFEHLGNNVQYSNEWMHYNRENHE